MSFAKAIVQLFRLLVVAIILVGLASGGDAKANASTHRIVQRPISHALPAATGSFSCDPLPAGSPDDYLTCHYSGPNDATMTFYLFVPAHYDPIKSYPLTVILHGSGERSIAGNTAAQNRAALLDNQYVAVWGPGSPPGGPSVQDMYPGFVLAPQIPEP